MTFMEFMTETRDRFRDDLNAFLSAKGMDGVRVISSSIEIENHNLTLAIFPTATSGSTFSEQGTSNIVHFTAMLFCNDEATEKGLAQGEEYYSALLEFIQKETFGESSSIEASIICRMDEGEAVNGAIFNIVSRISSNMDFGWN